MITQSIKDYVFSLKNIDECAELTINGLDIDGEILAVDLNDLYKFPNLEVYRLHEGFKYTLVQQESIWIPMI